MVTRQPVKKDSKKITSTLELSDWIADLSCSFSNRQIILLNGEMGVGKTQLVRFLGAAYGSSEVSSPTYALHYQYKMNGMKRDGSGDKTMDHLDLYRIESDDELESIGFWDLFAVKRGWVVIEWAEKVQLQQLPLDWPILSMDMVFGALRDSREIQLTWY